MANRIVSVDDTFTLPAAVKVSDANLPAGSKAAAIAAKAPLASPAFTGTPTGITKSHVGLANVDNTNDAAKPVSTAQATALGLKADKTTVATDLGLKADKTTVATDLGKKADLVGGKVPTAQLPAFGPSLTEDPENPGFYLIGA